MLILCILFCLFVTCNSSKYLVDEYKNIKEKDCAKSNIALDKVVYLKHIYGGCTHIIGNLVICDLKRYDNGTDPDLSFLKSIEDVSGYVYISRTTVHTIPLISLKVIRGESSYPTPTSNASLLIIRNSLNSTFGLEVLDLRNFVALQRNDVFLKDNSLLCNFGSTINWNQIFQNPDKQNVVYSRMEKTVDQIGCNIDEVKHSCHSSCPVIFGVSYCWGTEPTMCQKLPKCRDDMRKYCVSGHVSNQQCQEECLGGCENQPDNCTACKNAMNDNKCVPQCPLPLVVSREDSRTVANPKFKYNFHDICVKDCPAPFLKSDSFCVIECDLRTQIPVNGTCKDCPKSGCPEHCKQQEIFTDPGNPILRSDSLDKLESCSYYTGALYISQESFDSKWPNPIKTVDELYKLNKIKAIVGYIYIDLIGAPSDLKNLTFLSNLEFVTKEIRGDNLGPVIMIKGGTNLEMLGLFLLSKVNGQVYLGDLPKLCYTSALEKMTFLKKINVQDEKMCVNHGHMCNSECLPESGCWGPDANMCAHCCSLKAGDYCVSSCTDRPGYFELSATLNKQTNGNLSRYLCQTLPLTKDEIAQLDSSKISASRRPAKLCSKCHAECAETCYGFGSDQCIGKCRHYMHQHHCVAECPQNTYVDAQTNECLPCHELCTLAVGSDRLCSGPGSFLGLGGCSTCWTVIQDKSTMKYECLPDDCPSKHYIKSYEKQDFIIKENIPSVQTGESRKFVSMIRVCKPCHAYCDVCTADGTHRSICHSCLHWWFKSECVELCPPAETYSVEDSNLDDQKNITVNNVNNNSNSFLNTDGSSIINFNNTPISVNQIKDLDIQSGLNDSTKVKHDRVSLTGNILIKPKRPQKHCLLCHDECVQGCFGPGADECVKCRNYKIVIDEDLDKFICNSSCPDNQSNIFHGMCLNAEQYSRISGQSLRYLRNKILIGIAASIFIFLALIIFIVVICFKRKTEAEKIKEKLRLVYTNQLEPDANTQFNSREPNMGRLEMINIDDLQCDFSQSPLGTGSFGAVYRGLWKVPKHALLQHNWHRGAQLDVAIKVILVDNMGLTSKQDKLPENDSADDMKKASTRANLQELLQEAKVMASVMHRHCLPLVGICLSSERHCLVSIFLEAGSLDHYVKQYAQELNSLTLLTWAKQIADGMSYLEMRGIIHRDLAARNVLVQTRNHVQITDFGLSKMLERRDENSVVVKAGRVPIRWLAIETLQYGIYSHKTDVWSYSVTLWEIFTFGKRPYEDVDTVDIKDHVMKGGRLTQPDICTLDVYMIMVKCWMEDCESRPTFVELVRTFNNFCKTPGRYLYIEGDQYALNNFASPHSNNTTSVLIDSHELQPLQSMRDGETILRRNGMLNRPNNKVFTDTTLTSYNGQSKQFESGICDQFDTASEPNEMESLLPVRLHDGVSPKTSVFDVRPKGLGRMWMRTKDPSGQNQSVAPLASKEDSIFTEVSPHATNSLQGKEDVASDSSSKFTSSNKSKLFNADSATTDADQSFFASALFEPGNFDDYLEPKGADKSQSSTFDQNRPSKVNYTEINSSAAIFEDENYLNPNPVMPIGASGVTNPEYLMQPYYDNTNEQERTQ